MKKILVLLSTYNGMTYLEEQITSILHQEEVEVELFVRDDGSSDDTQQYLQAKQDQGLLRWYQGENIGPAQSFLALLNEAPQADFYALADQDDVWLPRKLATALQSLSTVNVQRPALYFGQTQPVDSHLTPLPYQALSPLITLGEALIHYFVGGNTMLLNHSFRQLIGQHRAKHIEMHDVYLYALALALRAHVQFDPKPQILYRQHSANAVGSPKQHFWSAWRKRLQRLFQRAAFRSHLAKEIWAGYAHLLAPEEKALLDDFIQAKHQFLKRLSLLTDPRLQCSSPSTQRLFRIALLLNTY